MEGGSVEAKADYEIDAELCLLQRHVDWPGKDDVGRRVGFC